MLYLKDSKGNLHDLEMESIVAICSECGKELKIDLGEEMERTGLDFYSSSYMCNECHEKALNAQTEEIEMDEHLEGFIELEVSQQILEYLSDRIVSHKPVYKIEVSGEQFAVSELQVNSIVDGWLLEAFSIDDEDANCSDFNGKLGINNSALLSGYGDYWFFSKKFAMKYMKNR